MRMKSSRRHAMAAATFVAVAVTLTIGQGAAGPSPPTGLVIDTGAFTPFVDNLDRSLAFYHDVLDMDVPPLPGSGARPFNAPNPRLFAFFAIPGAKERHQPAQVMGLRTVIESMEIQQVPYRTVPLRIQDPGNATLVLMVRDVDGTLTRVTRAGYPVVTSGGGAHHTR